MTIGPRTGQSNLASATGCATCGESSAPSATRICEQATAGSQASGARAIKARAVTPPRAICGETLRSSFNRILTPSAPPLPAAFLPQFAAPWRKRYRLDLRINAHPVCESERLPRLACQARQQARAVAARAERDDGDDLVRLDRLHRDNARLEDVE